MKKYTYDTINPVERIFLSQHIHTAKEEPHEHGFIELVYIFSGEGYQTVDNTVSYVQASDFIIMNNRSTHSFTPLHSIGIFNCIFIPGFLHPSLTEDTTFTGLCRYYGLLGDDSTAEPSVIHLYGKILSETDRLLNQMLREFTDKPNGYIPVLKAQLELLIISLARFIFPENENRIKQFRQQITPETISYIKSNYNRKLSLGELSQSCYYNPAYFSRLFKKTMGVTLTEYISHLRIMNAQKFLTETNMTVDEISLAVGFSNRTQFYKIFRQETGMSPNEYRHNRERPER